jgi:hypothetical protein
MGDLIRRKGGLDSRLRGKGGHNPTRFFATLQNDREVLGFAGDGKSLAVDGRGV